MSETQPNQPAETQPNKVSDTQPNKIKPGKAGFWISLLILLAALVLGGLAGYGRGIAERLDAKATLVANTLGEQLALAQQDIDAGRYDMARQRLEYIIEQEPGFPGVADKLAEVLVKQAITPSPVPTNTPTITPTPDLRSQEAIFAQAQQQLQAKDWAGTLGSLDSLRKADPAYKVVQVDGMYYVALRNRGIDQILGVGAYPQTNLEGGIYDLTLAERFGPLDGQADGLRNFARLYIIGASFWDIDWGQAVNYFSQVYQFAPNLRDASDVTAGQRYYEALLNLGDLQASAGKLKDRCEALNTWNMASNISPLNEEYSNKYFSLNLDCNPPTPTVDPATLVTPTVEVIVPTVDPNITPVVTP